MPDILSKSEQKPRLEPVCLTCLRLSISGTVSAEKMHIRVSSSRVSSAMLLRISADEWSGVVISAEACNCDLNVHMLEMRDTIGSSRVGQL